MNNGYRAQRFEIGFKFNRKDGKRGIKEFTVVDVERTIGNEGNLKTIQYICTTDFLGTKSKSIFPDTSLARTLSNEELAEHIDKDYTPKHLKDFLKGNE